MLSKVISVAHATSLGVSNRIRVVKAFFSTATREVEGTSSSGRGPIGADCRYEVWREGQSSDYDNEPTRVRGRDRSNASIENIPVGGIRNFERNLELYRPPEDHLMDRGELNPEIDNEFGWVKNKRKVYSPIFVFLTSFFVTLIMSPFIRKSYHNTSIRDNNQKNIPIRYVSQVYNNLIEMTSSSDSSLVALLDQTGVAEIGVHTKKWIEKARNTSRWIGPLTVPYYEVFTQSSNGTLQLDVMFTESGIVDYVTTVLAACRQFDIMDFVGQKFSSWTFDSFYQSSFNDTTTRLFLSFVPQIGHNNSRWQWNNTSSFTFFSSYFEFEPVKWQTMLEHRLYQVLSIFDPFLGIYDITTWNTTANIGQINIPIVDRKRDGTLVIAPWNAAVSFLYKNMEGILNKASNNDETKDPVPLVHSSHASFDVKSLESASTVTSKLLRDEKSKQNEPDNEIVINTTIGNLNVLSDNNVVMSIPNVRKSELLHYHRNEPLFHSDDPQQKSKRSLHHIDDIVNTQDFTSTCTNVILNYIAEALLVYLNITSQSKK